MRGPFEDSNYAIKGKSMQRWKKKHAAQWLFSLLAVGLSTAGFFSVSALSKDRPQEQLSGIYDTHAGEKNDIAPSAPETGEAEIVPPPGVIDASDIFSLPGLPFFGKWMYQHDLQKAHWLGVPWEGKTLIEPINLVLIDPVSKSADEAVDRLCENFRKAGYPNRSHHSSGYWGYINGRFYSQQPCQEHCAFSNEIAELPNNHGRVFGPCRFGNVFIFIAAFSRENLDPAAKIEHRYESFNRARDELSRSLDKKSGYKIVRLVDLHNAIADSRETSTGDHDGIAVVMELSAHQNAK
jgi:hypothetical protein